MPRPDAVTVTVPATTANIGPGFDCLGLALSRYNRFRFSRLPAAAALEIAVTGRDAAGVKTDGSNLAYRAFTHCYQQWGEIPPRCGNSDSPGCALNSRLGEFGNGDRGGGGGSQRPGWVPLGSNYSASTGDRPGRTS
ncbi:hypothetical protein [Neosynechococcus sphagnicola]|uniref:hypothetical protein n=1 Tax=Neosynechococcus sphagnicola TaxID=1501145 RepID=UPI000AA52CD7|nr:hypothetical protein [Neosynechococcus sphagnicola]